MFAHKPNQYVRFVMFDMRVAHITSIKTNKTSLLPHSPHPPDPTAPAQPHRCRFFACVTQWRAWLETIINLVVSFVCVFKFGIYGVLFGTIAALLYRANDIIIFANCKLLKRSAWPTYRRWLINLVIFSIVVGVFVKLPMNLNSYADLVKNAIWVSLSTIILFFTINSFVEVEARKIAYLYVKNIVHVIRNKRK